MHRGKTFAKTILFLLLTCAILSAVQKSFTRPDDEQTYHSVNGFYGLPKNSVDAVYIGSSSTFQFFQPPLAWKNHGIRVYSLSSDGLPSSALKYWLIEAHKRQPDAVILLNLNCFRDETVPGKILYYHSAVDHLPFSLNKLALIRELYARKPDADLMTLLELLVPMFRYHSTWNEIRTETLYREPNGYMGASTMWKLLSKVSPQKVEFIYDAEPQPTDSWQLEILDELCETIDSLGIRALFVITPQAATNERAGVYRYLENYVSERGFSCYNMQQEAGGLGLDLKADYYNAAHTNIHGSVKVTEAISRYLLEHFGFADRHGEPGTQSWENGSQRYGEEAGKYALDFELDGAPQTLDLSAPKDLSFAYSSENGGGSLMSWTGSADGFAVFRKTAGGIWERIGVTDGDAATFFDGVRTPADSYSYTVVPFQQNDGIVEYGRWNPSGISTGYYWPAPVLDEIWTDENGVTLTWDPSAGEKDWRVYRRETGGAWTAIGDTKDPWFTDGAIQPEMEYDYTVSAITSAGEGFRNEDGLHVIVPNKEQGE